MRKVLAALLLVVCVGALSAQADTEQGKIEYLIQTVAQMSDATFIRNGQTYDAKQAADHLRLKLRFAGSRAKTAEDFIACCATESSMSGKKYEIEFHDGHRVEAAGFLRDKLHEYEGGANAVPS